MQAPAAVNSHEMALYSKQVRCITMEVLCVCYIQPPRLLPLVLIQFRTGSAPALHMLRTRPNFHILTLPLKVGRSEPNTSFGIRRCAGIDAGAATISSAYGVAELARISGSVLN